MVNVNNEFLRRLNQAYSRHLLPTYPLNPLLSKPICKSRLLNNTAPEQKGLYYLIY